jgi:hypothetical protein
MQNYLIYFMSGSLETLGDGLPSDTFLGVVKLHDL